jgi:chemotaxis response regulator CheB
VVVVQHIDQRFADTFASWLDAQTDLPVRVIEEGSRLMPGHVLIAKTNDHLLLDEDARLSYSPVPRDYAYRPSVDVFFHCIASHWRQRAIGVLLTGMGRDADDRPGPGDQRRLRHAACGSRTRCGRAGSAVAGDLRNTAPAHED